MDVLTRQIDREGAVRTNVSGCVDPTDRQREGAVRTNVSGCVDPTDRQREGAVRTNVSGCVDSTDRQREGAVRTNKIQDTRNFILRRFVYINISSIELVSDYK